MRTVKEIVQEINAARGRIEVLQRELAEVYLTDWLKEQGVPEGAKPVFKHIRKGERVLVTGWDSIWPFGFALKKNGDVGESRRTLYIGDYVYVGETAVSKRVGRVKK